MTEYKCDLVFLLFYCVFGRLSQTCTHIICFAISGLGSGPCERIVPGQAADGDDLTLSQLYKPLSARSAGGGQRQQVTDRLNSLDITGRSAVNCRHIFFI